jgi:phage shock protein A
MSITIRTVEDLIRVLEEHPEWRERLLAVLLGQEFLQVPARLDRIEAVLERLVESHEQLWQSHRQLLESHQQLWESHRQLQESHQQLWESHQQALARLDRLETIVQQLLESHRQQLWQSHQQLWKAIVKLQESHRQLLESHQMLVAEVRELRQTVEQLVNWMQRLDTDVGKLKGKCWSWTIYSMHRHASATMCVARAWSTLDTFWMTSASRDTSSVWMNGRSLRH